MSLNWNFDIVELPINRNAFRYFYLRLAQLHFEKLNIVDIGASTVSADWQPEDFVLLGALHIHEGISVDGRFASHLRQVSFVDAACRLQFKSAFLQF